MIRPLTALFAGLAMASTGCAGKPAPQEPSGPKTTTVVVSYDELVEQKVITREVTLAVGDTLQVSLGSNPSTGYQWAEEMRISDPDVLAQTGHEVLKAAADRPGAAGSEVWALQAIGLGTTTVTTRYGRPWEGGEKDAWTFTAEVTVK